jgi:hypothetical protein
MDDERSGHEQGRVGVRVQRGVERPLGDGHIAGLLDEPPELADRHGPLVDPKVLGLDPPDRRLLRIGILRAHRELAAGQPLYSVQPHRRAEHGHTLSLARRHESRIPQLPDGGGARLIALEGRLPATGG